MNEQFLEALQQRHLSNLTRAEVTRALRALSSCYVERRGKLAAGAALEGAGKRAAFALFYGPLHFCTIQAVVKASGLTSKRLSVLHDLGCGTGVGGVAWTLAGGEVESIAGLDRSAWAIEEANWTYRTLGLRGRASRGDLGRWTPRGDARGEALLLGYAANELPDDARASLLDTVERRLAAGSQLLVIEPVATKLGLERWWPHWRERLAPFGVVEREWRFPSDLPPLVRDLGRAAGLRLKELTARTLSSDP